MKRSLVAISLLVFVLVATVIAWPRLSRLTLDGSFSEAELAELSASGVSVGPLSADELTGTLFASTGPEVATSRGQSVSVVHLAHVNVAATSLYAAWDGPAYVLFFGSTGASQHIIIMSALDAKLILDQTFVSFLA